MENSLIIQPANTNIIYDINPDVVTELKAEQELILANIPENIAELDIELVKKAKRKSVKLRTGTEAQRKEYKAWVLSYGRLVDSKATEALEPVAEIENIYDKLIKDYDDYFANLARIAAEKEAQRIANIENRIAKIDSYKIKAFNADTSKQISDLIVELTAFIAKGFDYQEFTEIAHKNEESTIDSLNKMFDTLNSAEIQRKIDEDNCAKFEAEKAEFIEQQCKAQEEAESKFKAEREAIEAKQREENEKLAAERRAIQELRDKAESEERERLRKIEDEARAAELAKLEEARKKAAEAETLRLQKILEEESARKLAQEKEDRVRNAAPQLLQILELLLYKMPTFSEREYEEDLKSFNEIVTKAESIIKLAKGE